MGLVGLRLLLAAGALIAGAGEAQAPGESPRTSAVPVEVHFAPPQERKPVPYELANNHILFKARVEGREVWAMLDNGLGATAVDSGFARSSGLQLGPPAERALTPVGSLEARLVSDVSIAIPGQMEVRAPVRAIDLSAVSKLLGRPVSLIIGKDYFDNLAVFVSASTRTLQLAPSGTMQVPHDTPQLAFKNGEAQIDISISGKSAVVTLDLGSDDQLGLSEAAWNRLGLNHPVTSDGTSIGADGRRVPTKRATVGNVSIGPISARNLAVTIGPVLPSFGDGLIGMGFLSGFDFLMDLKARRLWLSPLGSRANANAFQSDVQAAIAMYQSGQSSDGRIRLAELHARAKSATELNILCWSKAAAGIMLDSAVQECSQAVSLSNRDPHILDSLGFALLRSGKLDEALAAYGEAIKKAQIAGSYMGRAIVYARKGDTLRAQADAAEARKRDPGIEAQFAGYGLPLAGAATGPVPR